MSVAFRKPIVVLAVSFLQLFSGHLAYSQMPTQPSFEVFPAPPEWGIPQSPQFKVTLLQNGKELDSPVYLTQKPSQAPTPPFESTTAWTSFATNGPVTVRVQNQNPNSKVPFYSARILPSHARIVPTLSGGNQKDGYTVVSFTMIGAGPQQVSVEFCYTPGVSSCDETTEILSDITNPLLVFANPLSDNIPRVLPLGRTLYASPGNSVQPLGDDEMVYFGPGVYDLGPNPYVLANGKQAFLAGGAYVSGMFAIGHGVTISGLGILSGKTVSGDEVCTQTPCPMMIDGSNVTGKVTINGITIVDLPYYNIKLSGAVNTVSNIKVISWLANTDGISPGSGTLSNSFFKTGDDAIKLYSSNLTVSGCTMWQLGNAAPFEMGVNLSEDVTKVTVENCDVIRTEWIYPNRSNAVISAAFGGNAKGSYYTFRDIRVENTNPAGFKGAGLVFQLFKLAVIPNPWSAIEVGNNSLGSISNVTFSNIQVTDQTTLPNLFQSFDLQHQVSGITFDNVTVLGQTLPQPTPTFNANRNFSLSGTVFSNILWRSASESTLFLADVFPGAADVPATPPTQLYGPPFAHEAWAIGDVDGNGQASVLFQSIGPRDHRFGVWDQPMSASPLYEGIWTDYVFNTGAGIGDFNGDGRSDILLWNEGAGTILLMGSAQVIGATPEVIGTIPVKPTRSDIWSVAGVGDIDQNGYSDIILRDPRGNIQLLSFGATPEPTPHYLPVRDFSYGTGTFDSSWQVAAVGDLRGLGYASIVWANPDLPGRDHGLQLRRAAEGLQPAAGGQMPVGSYIASTGDFNGDGTMDLLLVNSNGDQTIWYTGYYDGAPYKAGPAPPAQAGYTVQPRLSSGPPAPCSSPPSGGKAR